jgi:hypothetical protein
MNSRSLLERAAKAAGLVPDDGNPYDQFYGLSIKREPQGVFTPCYWWNPLTDDGDALRLAVKLRMNLVMETPHAVKAGWAVDQPDAPTRDGLGPWYWKEWIRDHPSVEAATRSAIVNAAAALAKD